MPSPNNFSEHHGCRGAEVCIVSALHYSKSSTWPAPAPPMTFPGRRKQAKLLKSHAPHARSRLCPSASHGIGVAPGPGCRDAREKPATKQCLAHAAKAMTTIAKPVGRSCPRKGKKIKNITVAEPVRYLTRVYHHRPDFALPPRLFNARHLLARAVAHGLPDRASSTARHVLPAAVLYCKHRA
jgi:hypothetical protein